MRDHATITKLKKRIIFRLINRERNPEILRNVPHRDIQDLSMIYSMFLGDSLGEILTMPIDNECIKYMGISEDELYQYALKNTPLLLPAEITHMADLVMRVIRENSGEEEDNVMEGQKEAYNDMQILTNRYGIGGAGVILYPNILEELAEKLESDLILLPSSIHEWIVLSWEDVTKSVASLWQMVQYVNLTEVMPEEVLSDAVYCFRRGNAQIEMLVRPDGSIV